MLAYHHHLEHSGLEHEALAIEQNFNIKWLTNKYRKITGESELCQLAKHFNTKLDFEPQAILKDNPKALEHVDDHRCMLTSNFAH